MKLLTNLNVRSKLVALVVVPLAGLMYLVGTEIIDKQHDIRNAEAMSLLTQVIGEVASVVHHLQIERGASVLFISNQEAGNRAQLDLYRSQTDEAVGGLERLVGTIERDHPVVGRYLPLQSMGQALTAVPVQRAALQGGNVPYQAVVTHYTGLIENLFDTLPVAIHQVEDASLMQGMVAFKQLSLAKESEGLERALLAGVFSRDRITAPERDMLIGLIVRREENLDGFLSHGLPEQVEVFSSTLRGRAAIETTRLENLVVENTRGSRFGVDPNYWFEMKTTKIDQLYTVERALVDQLHAQEAALMTAAKEARLFYFAEAVLAFLLTVIGVLLITRTTAAPLVTVTSLAETIAHGDLSVTVPSTDRTDEVGDLIRSLGAMVAKWRQQITEMQRGIQVLSTSASQISASVSQVTSSVAETATSVTETTTTVEQVKQTAQDANGKAQAVVSSAEEVNQISTEGRNAVEEVVESMSRIKAQMEQVAEHIVFLSKQGQTIGEITSTVRDLAEQSNLLAVNAAIEAAKAGAEGKGFAVLAREIRSLAEQSKAATQRVQSALAEIQQATGEAVMATEQGSKAVEAGMVQSHAAGQTIRMLAERIMDSSDAAIQIEASSRQQFIGIDQITAAMRQIRQASSMNIESMRQLEDSSQQLQDVGTRLRSLSEAYTI